METSNMTCYANQMTGYYIKCSNGLKWVNIKQESCFGIFVTTKINCFYACLIAHFIRLHILCLYFPSHFIIWIWTPMSLSWKRLLGYIYKTFNFEMKPQMLIQHFTWIWDCNLESSRNYFSTNFSWTLFDFISYTMNTLWLSHYRV